METKWDHDERVRVALNKVGSQSVPRLEMLLGLANIHARIAPIGPALVYTINLQIQNSPDQLPKVPRLLGTSLIGSPDRLTSGVIKTRHSLLPPYRHLDTFGSDNLGRRQTDHIWGR